MPTTNPTPATLRLPPNRHPVPTRTRLRTRPVPIIAYVVILLALPVAVYVGARASGWWVTTGRTVPSTALGAPEVSKRPAAGAGQGNEGTTAEPRTGDGSGSGSGSGQGREPITGGNPDDVRGSMTVKELLDAFPQITAAEVYRQFGVPASTPTSTQLKTLAQDGNGYEVSDLREWLKTKQ